MSLRPFFSVCRKLVSLAFLFAGALVACADPIQITVGALGLPAGSSGLVHLRTSEAESEPLQLSTRYFSEAVSIGIANFELHAAPLGKTQPAGAPLLRLPIPAGITSCLVVIWDSAAPGKAPAFTGRVFSASDWPTGSMLLMNAAAVPIGIQTGSARQMLKPGARVSFPGKNPEEDLPVKMYLEDEKQPGKARTVFSSLWKISSQRRELCVIYSGSRPQSVEIRSLLERGVPKAQ